MTVALDSLAERGPQLPAERGVHRAHGALEGQGQRRHAGVQWLRPEGGAYQLHTCVGGTCQCLCECLDGSVCSITIVK